MYDLLVPIESYKREIDKLKVLAASAGSDGNNSTSNMAKGRKEHEKYNTLMDKLQVYLICLIDFLFFFCNTKLTIVFIYIG